MKVEVEVGVGVELAVMKGGIGSEVELGVEMRWKWR